MTWSISIVLLTIGVASSVAFAHPLSQGSLDVIVNPDKVTVRARVTAEEVAVTNSATDVTPLPGPWAATGQAAYEHHAEYLANHLHLRADGKVIIGRVVEVDPPQDMSTKDAFANYLIEYVLEKKWPLKVELSEDILSDGQFAAGMKWEATYIVIIQQAGGSSTQWLLHNGSQPVTMACGWDAAAGVAYLPVATTNRSRLFKEYFVEGVHHILTGYDHLLFVSALVLAATSLWDLIKVVSAFTLSHTITLTLAALNLIHVPSYISEPLISASIVFVALQNVFWPRQAKGWHRMAAAFFFGLFHGLGFAGGLLEAMHGMQGATVLLAILGFSIGVETGHQMVVLPLFTGLKFARATQRNESSRNHLSFVAQRFGSAAISLAGLWFLVNALKESFHS